MCRIRRSAGRSLSQARHGGRRLLHPVVDARVRRRAADVEPQARLAAHYAVPVVDRVPDRSGQSGRCQRAEMPTSNRCRHPTTTWPSLRIGSNASRRFSRKAYMTGRARAPARRRLSRTRRSACQLGVRHHYSLSEVCWTCRVVPARARPRHGTVTCLPGHAFLPSTKPSASPDRMHRPRFFNRGGLDRSGTAIRPSIASLSASTPTRSFASWCPYCIGSTCAPERA